MSTSAGEKLRQFALEKQRKEMEVRTRRCGLDLNITAG